MKIVRTVASLRQALDARPPGSAVGFVPTMGALHDGHVALIRAARAACRQVVVSIFVNPKQFNDAGDLARYPRQESRDTEMADEAGADILFMPEPAEMYPDGHATSLHMTGPALGFEGDHRPGHFDGVAIVCLKLFAMVQPDVVFLGQKDAQQVAVLRQLVRDVNLRLELRVVPTVRDLNGLAHLVSERPPVDRGTVARGRDPARPRCRSHRVPRRRRSRRRGSGRSTRSRRRLRRHGHVRRPADARHRRSSRGHAADR